MKKYGIPIAVLVVIAVVLVWWLTKSGGQPSSNVGNNTVPQEAAGLGAQVFDQVSQNPVGGKMPDTNPLKAEANPYKGAYTNPF
jgi:hypothetical protein